MTVEEAIADGASKFADAEEAAAAIKHDMRSLKEMFTTIRDAGHIGALECKALATECDRLATTFEADLWALHSRLTKRAQELGIDLPSTRDGGR